MITAELSQQSIASAISLGQNKNFRISLNQIKIFQTDATAGKPILWVWQKDLIYIFLYSKHTYIYTHAQKYMCVYIKQIYTYFMYIYSYRLHVTILITL